MGDGGAAACVRRLLKRPRVRSLGGAGELSGKRREPPWGDAGRVFGFGEEDVVRACGWVEPGEEPEEVWAGHGGAAGAGFVRTAADVEEDGAAVAGDGRVRVVADFEEEFVGEVA